MISRVDGDVRTRSIFIKNAANQFPKPIPEVLPVIPDQPKTRFFKAQKFVQFSEDQKFKTLDDLIDGYNDFDWDVSGMSSNQPTDMLLEAAFKELVETGLAYECEDDTIPKNVAVVERHIAIVIS